MKIELIEAGEKPVPWLKLKVSGVKPYFINAIRRAVISEVPTLAIEDVHILANDSGLYDEVLALRLGLIPLWANPAIYWTKRDLKIAFVLKAEGPKTVYSGELQSQDPEVKPTFDSIPVTVLLEGQRIDLEAYATVGTGKEHAKWQGGYAFYRKTGEDEFEFYVETWTMEPKEMLRRAAMVITEQINDFEKALKDAKVL